MKVDFESIESSCMPCFKGGVGVTEAKMFFDGKNRILLAHLKPDSTIGHHTHDSSSEVMIFLSGIGKIVCDGEEEPVRAGTVHYCPKGSSHTLINTGNEDIVMYCVVAEQ